MNPFVDGDVIPESRGSIVVLPARSTVPHPLHNHPSLSLYVEVDSVPLPMHLYYPLTAHYQNTMRQERQVLYLSLRLVGE